MNSLPTLFFIEFFKQRQSLSTFILIVSNNLFIRCVENWNYLYHDFENLVEHHYFNHNEWQVANCVKSILVFIKSDVHRQSIHLALGWRNTTQIYLHADISRKFTCAGGCGCGCRCGYRFGCGCVLILSSIQTPTPTLIHTLRSQSSVILMREDTWSQFCSW